MKYGLGVLAIIVIAFVAILLIVRQGPSSTSTSTAKKKTTATSLLDYDNSESSVQLTIQGRLTGEDQHQSVRITVTQSKRTVEIINGYEDNIIKSQTFPNTPAAYTNFIQAINNAGYSKSRKAVAETEIGICPSGNRYVYQLNKGSEKIQRLWADNCAAGDGNFAGRDR